MNGSPGAAVKRVSFREQQTLRSDDLNDEQAYRLATRRRHNIAHHEWGIASGLELLTVGQPSRALVIACGVAIDGYGRQLLYSRPQRVDPDDLQEAFRDAHCRQGKRDDKTASVDVWLTYHRVAILPAQSGSYDCGPGQETRWLETPAILYTTSGQYPPREPPFVVEEDLNFGPHQTPPDNPDSFWPVFLGRVDGHNTGGTWEIEEPDASGRPYTAALGESLATSSGEARVQIGSELEADRRRFAVAIREQVPSDDGGEPSFRYRDRLVLDTTANTIAGDARIRENDLIIAEHWELTPADFREPRRFLDRLRDLLRDGISRHDETNADDVRSVLRSLANQMLPLLARKYGRALEDADAAKAAESKRTFDVTALANVLDRDRGGRNVLDSLNEVLRTGRIYDQRSFQSVDLRAITRQALQQAMSPGELLMLNRLLMEDAFPDDIVRRPARTLPPRGLSFANPTPATEAPSPWRIYRTTAAGEDEPQRDELRFEIAHPGEEGDPTRNALVVGQNIDALTFSPTLVASADSVVRINGNLTIEGQLIQGPIPADADDPRFRNELLRKWGEGIEEVIKSIQAQRLLVAVSDMKFVPTVAGSAIQYRLSIKNVGTDQIEQIRAFAEIQEDDGAGQSVGSVLAEAINLGPDESAEVTPSHELETAAKKVRVFVLATNGEIFGQGENTVERA